MHRLPLQRYRVVDLGDRTLMTAAMAAATGVAIPAGGEVFDMVAGVAGSLTGFNDGPGPDYGTNSPANFLGDLVIAFRFEVAATDNFKVAIDGQFHPQTLFTRVTVVGDAWDIDLLTADADAFDDEEQSSQTSWEWDDEGHAVFTDTESYVVTLFP